MPGRLSGHLREDEVQQLGAVETADLGVEVELLDDVGASRASNWRSRREGCGDLRRVGQDAVQGKRTGVVPSTPVRLLRTTFRAFSLSIVLARASTCGWVGSREQSRRRRRTRGRMTFWYSGALVVGRQQVSDGPDEPGVVVGLRLWPQPLTTPCGCPAGARRIAPACRARSQ